MTTNSHKLAASLTPRQRAELLSYQDGEGFRPPLNAACARYMWGGIFPRALGSSEPVFLLRRAHRSCLYVPSDLGKAVRAVLIEEAGNG